MTFIEEVRKPFNLVTLTLTIISLGLSVVFYFNGKKEKNLSFQLNEPASLVFDRENSSSKIKLLENDSFLITNNVYLLTGTIWNSGDIPISKSDIRKPITLDVENASRILDFKIIRQKDPSIAKFRLNRITDLSLGLDWDYFDPKYGFSFQIMYIGNGEPKFNLSGIVLDIQKFEKVKQTIKEDRRISFAMLVAYSILIFFIVWRILKRKSQRGKIDLVYLVMLVVCLIVVIYLISTRLMNNYIPI